MLNVYKEMFSRVKNDNISCAVWKSNDKLELFLSGYGDLDLWVNDDDRSRFVKILAELRFVEFFPFVNKFDNISHYYCFSEGKVVHLHVYYKFVTGESNTKNYTIPLEQVYVKHIVNSDLGVPIPSIELSRSVFLIRHFIKIGSLYGILIFFRDKDKYSSEYKYLSFESDSELIYEPNIIKNELMNDMLISIIENVFLKNVIVSFKVKLSLMKYSRLNFFNHFLYKIKDFNLRLLNKALIKRKKRARVGLVFSICGLDGSGKSTAVNNIGEGLKKDFDYKIIHMGRPKPTHTTLPFWILFRIAEKIKHSHKSENIPIESFIPKRKISLIGAFRYYIIAKERKKAALKAYNLSKKGYLIVTDRYPSEDYGKMDSPRILEDSSRGFLYQFFHRKEKKTYETLPPSDLSVKLNIPVETAVKRNAARDKYGKETANEIRARYMINNNFRPKSNKSVIIDASKDVDVIKDEIMELIFDELYLLNR